MFNRSQFERWRAQITLRRDVVIEVVHKVYVFPLDHRARLVKLTERRFETSLYGIFVRIERKMFVRFG